MRHALEAELKQATPYALIEEEAHVAIARTAALLERAVSQTLKPYGVTPTQYNVLRILRGAGDAGLCRNEVGARLVTPVPDVTRLLDRMADDDLLTRERADADRRLVRTKLTKKGRTLVNAIDATLHAAHRARLAHIPAPALRALVRTLSAIRAPLV